MSDAPVVLKEVVVAIGGLVVVVGGWVADTSGGGVSDVSVVLGEAVAARVSVGAVGCVLSLLVAQAVAVSAAMARTDTLRRCLIKIAPTVLMPLDNSTHQAAGQVLPDW